MKCHSERRQGFTLVEILVVLTIIAVLMALAAASTSKIIGVSQYNTTANTIRKVYSRLQSQRAAVMKAAEKEDIATTQSSSVYNSILAAAGYNSSSPSSSIQDWGVRTRVIYTKLRLKQEFPMTFVEALGPTPLAAKPAYVKAFTGLSGTDTSGVNYQASACLLKALQEGRQGSAVTGDDYGSTSVRLFTDSANHSQVPALVDGWGMPLLYYRWPTGSSEVDGLAPAVQTSVTGQAASTTQSIVRDPEDPLGMLMNANWYSTSGRTTFESWCHSMTNNSAQYAFYLIPVVASSGPDKLPGLTSPTMAFDTSTGNVDTDKDNVYSFRLMPPGARGD